jgi:hypothetical protein
MIENCIAKIEGRAQRSLLASLALLGGCFSIPADEQPTHSQHHIELLIDAGRWDVNAGPGDAGPRDAGHSDAGSADTGQPDAGPSPGVVCGDQTCEQGISCLIVLENQNWELHCLSRSPGKAADTQLTSRLAQRCIEFEAPQDGDCNPGDCGRRGFRGCMENPGNQNEVACFREYGACGGPADCMDRGAGNNLQCKSVDDEEHKFESALSGRCRVAEMEYHQLMGGAIGFWARKDGQDVCGLAYCDDGDPGASCSDYLQVNSDHGGGLLPQLFADALAPGATCGAIPGHQAAPAMCDWRECGNDRDCRRQYLIREAQCSEHGWCMIENTDIYLNQYAHGPGTEDSHRGFDRCNNRCDRGRVCAVNTQTEEMSCAPCNRDEDCPDDAECWQGQNGDPGSCRYSCESQQDCIHGEYCNLGAHHCEREQGGPGPNANPCDGFNCGGPNLQCQNVVIYAEEGFEVWQPVCQEIICQSDQGCQQAPGSVCHAIGDGNSECTIHGLCQGDGDCGGGGCRMFTNDQSAQQRLCLDLSGPGAQCDNDDDCIGRRAGSQCLLGRICGFYHDINSGCPEGFSSFAGFCPQPPACANHQCPQDQDCRTTVMDLNGQPQVRAACTPRGCSRGEDHNCPVPFFCKPGDDNGGLDSCEYVGFCGGDVTCPDGMQCQSYQSNRHCFDLSSDCSHQTCPDDYICLGGFCATTSDDLPACIAMQDHQQFAGFCKPQ